jgi:hypothetical protein
MRYVHRTADYSHPHASHIVTLPNPDPGKTVVRVICETCAGRPYFSASRHLLDRADPPPTPEHDEVHAALVGLGAVYEPEPVDHPLPDPTPGPWAVVDGELVREVDETFSAYDLNDAAAILNSMERIVARRKGGAR